MSIDPQISPLPPAVLLGMRGLFPAAAIVALRHAPGDPADLLPAEAACVIRSVPKRIREFAAGRACARAALKSFDLHDFALRAAADRQPLWPDGFVGSITHTAGFCAAVVARRSAVLGVGIDSEIVGAPSADLWPTIGGSDELTWLRTLPAHERPAAMTLLFSAKEAFYKCQYPVVGEWLDFHDLRIDVPAWGAPTGMFRVVPQRSLQFARHVVLPLAGRYLFHEKFVSAGVTVERQ